MTDQLQQELASFLRGRTLQQRAAWWLEVAVFYLLLAAMWLAGGRLRVASNELREAARQGRAQHERMV